MCTETLRSFLEKEYPGMDAFLERVIYRIFDQTEFEAIGKDDYAQKADYSKQAEATGIRNMVLKGEVYAGTTPLQVFDITVDDHVKMAHNRVALQLLTRRIMEHRSAAFMVFHYDEAHAANREWRFSFCYKSSESEQTTDPKRFTFLLGPGHSCRTAANNFQELFKKKGQEETIANLQKAFSVEALSEEFFDKYRKHYAQFVLHATGKQANKWEEPTEHAPDEAIMQAFGGDEKRVRDYVKKLLGRIVFLHFLQKKGWMGVPDGGSWGEGKLQFMSELFREATAEQQADFVHEVLEHLFFHALNTDRKADNDLYDTRVFPERVRVPYLNGGLFEEDDADRCFKACTDARFPAELFEKLFAFFEQYNFTIDENDPDDAQVGVDPEMLGRIFERLLEDNKEKGAFYTPKEIVQYMCRRSLTAYLQANVPDERMRKKIDEFIRTKDYDCLHVQDDVPDERMPKAIDECVCTKDYDGLFVCKGLRMENPEIIISHMNEQGEIIEAFRKSASDLISQADKFVWDLSNPSLQMSVTHEGFLRLGDLCYISKGMVLNADEKTARGEFSKDDLISNTQDSMHPKPYIEAKDIEPYRVKHFRFLEYDTPRCPDRLSRPTFRELYECPKLMINRLGNLQVYLDAETHLLHSDSIYSAVLWKDLKGVENKSIKASVTRYSTKERQEMEQLSEQVNLHYLLGLLNSRYMAVLLTRQRGGDYHIYPEHLRALPIPPADKDKQHAVACLVKEVIEAKNHDEDCTDSLQALDRLVYELYDLTEDEIRLMEGTE